MFDKFLSNNSPANPWVAKLQEQFGLSNQEAQGTAQAAQESLTEELKKESGQGNWSSILDLFSSKNQEESSQNPLFQQILGNFGSKLQGLGLPSGKAQELAAQFLPQFFGQVQNQVKDEQGQVSQQGILSNFLGGASLDGVKNILGKFF